MAIEQSLIGETKIEPKLGDEIIVDPPPVILPEGLYLRTDNTGTPQYSAPLKADIGLDQVDNTADVDKPVSNPQQAALDAVKAQITPPISPPLGATNRQIVPFKKSIFLKIFIIGSIAIILSFLLIESLGLHVVKTRNTFRIEGTRIVKGQVKHRIKTK